MPECNQLVYKKFVIILVSAFVSFCLGCREQPGPEPVQSPSAFSPEPEKQGSSDAWTIYWDNDVGTEVTRRQYDSVILFASYHRPDFSVYVPETMWTLKENLKAYEGTRYLSFTNDVLLEDGTSTQKSAEFLAGLLRDESAWDKVYEEYISLAEQFGAEGIEIDFEKVDSAMYEEYAAFLENLRNTAREHGLKMRVVLEYRLNPDEIDLPDGPDYIVMCYNLYGYHSGPGPKADPAFLKKAADKFGTVEGIGYGLANGGFEWSPDGKVIRSLTSPEAVKLAREKNAVPSLDKGSMALSFQWKEDDGLHTVWYGNDETIRYWNTILDEASGRDVSVTLWRIEKTELNMEN